MTIPAAISQGLLESVGEASMLPSAAPAKSIAAEPGILIRSTVAMSSCVIASLSVFCCCVFPTV